MAFSRPFSLGGFVIAPIHALRVCLNGFANFSGRLRRPDYWWFWAIVSLGGVGVVFLHGAIFGPTVGVETVVVHGPDGATTQRFVETATYDGGNWARIYALLAFLPVLAAGWRRLHDVGRPGWLLLTPPLPLLGGVLMGLSIAVLSARPGETAMDSMQFGNVPQAMVLAALGALGSFGLWLFALVCLLSPSQPGPNRFGPEPPAA